MKKLMGISITFLAFVLVAASAYSNEGREKKSGIKITHYDEHNQMMNQCIQTALERHAGGVIEVELEQEDGKVIFDIDIQGKDGKEWEIECDAATGAVIEDKEEKEEKKENK